MFMEESGGSRINQVRAAEAQATGSGTVAVNCPFCVQMFDDGLAAAEPDQDSRAHAADLAELLAEAVFPGEN